ncbi:hypothetical protein TTRE_0000917101 [Trichuris trichiura]|uniref:Uncharacterized protein n=1 Tax=Trichuris trichiura TaxID=36087 RepID=A0A077ZKA7_TRITR|nr:hypothetical protein TTRE_0000917101 [Trichuris trichiura]
MLNYNCCFVGMFVFHQDEEGKFFIQQGKQAHASLFTVDEAARNYKLWGTMLQVQTLGSINFYVLVRSTPPNVALDMQKFWHTHNVKCVALKVHGSACGSSLFLKRNLVIARWFVYEAVSEIVAVDLPVSLDEILNDLNSV